MEFRCIECGFRIRNNKPLFVQYSPGNIRLMKCENCKAVADGYIECELMILLIDLILHKPKAYRHLLYNVLNPQVVSLEGLFWKSIFAFLLLDTYRILVLNWSDAGWKLPIRFSSLVLRYGKMLMDLLLGNFMFLYILLIVTRFFLDKSAGVSRYKDILLAIFISSYFKVFFIAMMVWEFPASVLFIIDIFVLSSNTVALKVITELSVDKCFGACFSAYAVKFLVKGALDIICQDH
ncbi:protein arv1 homolog [Camellia sinensis]|uniref:protein arv1 homolog n=1 Tax=Camellia sinensis TaxID=4442 RepID=UPI0010367803|nr:protein arv1 homolog [Camellia sinensis]XP_028091245.1 protein arv1 homolog [Camellia sinensis]XP_028091246.1 protein arv1 homolog [Camellia sinensis]